MTVQVTFGRYLLERRIANGGMGEVFLARQTGPSGFDRVCVVKRMHPHLEADPEVSSMFLEEAQLTAQITHPYVAQVYDFGRVDNAFYLAMEYVDGPPLGTVIKHFSGSGRFVPLDFVCRVVSQAAQALDHVHRLKDAQGVALELIHRDISPQNILVSKDGLTKVIDFGIAKARTTARRTQVGLVRGKIGYLSPEQLASDSLDFRTDIYSLGLVMYELVTGRRAVLGNNDLEMIGNIRARNWPAAATVRPDCPKALLDVISKATEPDRNARYGSMAELSAALETVIAQQGYMPLAPRLGEIASEVMSGRRTEPTGFDSPTDTDINTQAQQRAVATTAQHRGPLQPWERQTQPDRSAVTRRPPARRGLWTAAIFFGVAAVAFAGALWWMNRRPPAPVPVVLVPDVKMPEPGPPPEVVVAPRAEVPEVPPAEPVVAAEVRVDAGAPAAVEAPPRAVVKKRRR